MEDPVILGVSLGTRRVGIAIGTKDILLERQVKGFDERFSEKKMQRICRSIEKLIALYGISGIAVKAPRAISRSKAINQTMAALSMLALSQRIPIVIYDLEALEGRFISTVAKNKTKLACAMVQSYPELMRFYSKIESGKKTYYIKMFEAVAAMRLFSESLGNLP